MPPKERSSQWAIKRVFFLTPQVMQNDITRGACPAGQVCCVVFDEAHKALGNYSYCQVQHAPVFLIWEHMQNISFNRQSNVFVRW